MYVPRGCFPPNHVVSTDLLAEVIVVEASGSSWSTALDLGCGAGALTLLLASQRAYTVGVDVSERCIRAALLNADRNNLHARVDFVVCPTANCLREKSFDLCVANPPYLPLKPRLDYEFSFAGGERLETTRNILESCRQKTSEDGRFFVVLNDMAYKWIDVSSLRKIKCAKTPFDIVCVFTGSTRLGVFRSGSDRYT